MRARTLSSELVQALTKLQRCKALDNNSLSRLHSSAECKHGQEDSSLARTVYGQRDNRRRHSRYRQRDNSLAHSRDTRIGRRGQHHNMYPIVQVSA